MNSVPNLRVLPIQIWLLLGKQTQVKLASPLIICPGRLRISQFLGPVVRRNWSAILGEGFGLLPDIPITFRVVYRLGRFNEPVVFVGSVIDDEVHHELHVMFVQGRNQCVDIFEGAVDWIDVFIVRDIVTHICLGRLVD